MMLEQRIAIVGLGLMGGSLALAIRPFLSHLTIIDSNPDALAAAEKLVDVVTADFATGVRHADLIIFAAPVRTILGQLARIPQLRPDGCLIFDLGSTKAEICEVMAALPSQFQAIGGHPMCGKEKAGFAAATVDLYQDQTFILCRNGRTTAYVEKVAIEIINLIGARPLFLRPDLHDNFVAAVSHLPYLVSAVLMQSAAAMDDERLWQVSASGFRGMSRLSGSNPHMMLDILLTNKTAVLAQLETYRDELTAVIQQLQSNDETALAQWLDQTQSQHVAYRVIKHKT